MRRDGSGRRPPALSAARRVPRALVAEAPFVASEGAFLCRDAGAASATIPSSRVGAGSVRPDVLGAAGLRRSANSGVGVDRGEHAVDERWPGAGVDRGDAARDGLVSEPVAESPTHVGALRLWAGVGFASEE